MPRQACSGHLGRGAFVLGTQGSEGLRGEALAGWCMAQNRLFLVGVNPELVASEGSQNQVPWKLRKPSGGPWAAGGGEGPTPPRARTRGCPWPFLMLEIQGLWPGPTLLRIGGNQGCCWPGGGVHSSGPVLYPLASSPRAPRPWAGSHGGLCQPGAMGDSKLSQARVLPVLLGLQPPNEARSQL